MIKIKIIATLKTGIYQAKISTGRMWKYLSSPEGRPITGNREEIKEYCKKSFGECKFYE